MNRFENPDDPIYEVADRVRDDAWGYLLARLEPPAPAPTSRAANTLDAVRSAIENAVEDAWADVTRRTDDEVRRALAEEVAA